MACSWRPSPSTRQVPGSSPGSGGRAARAFFLPPPFLPPSGDSFFRTFPTNPAKVLGLILRQLTLILWNRSQTIKWKWDTIYWGSIVMYYVQSDDTPFDVCNEPKLNNRMHFCEARMHDQRVPWGMKETFYTTELIVDRK